MSTLTPEARKDEAAGEATSEGLMNGFLTLIPCSGGLYVAMQNPTFMKRTNWQSRTALVIMPALFVFAYTSERHLERKMHQIAAESKHTARTVEWGEQQLVRAITTEKSDLSETEKSARLTALFQESINQSNVKIVPGDSLSLHHKAANFTAENPFKILGAAAVPAVGWIFYGRTGKEHLQLSMKILHTRVFGQFATLSLLLGLMGFKEFMDRNGKFITQAEADQRVQEMMNLRSQLNRRLEHEKELQEAAKKEIAEAHEQDLKDAAAAKAKKK